MDKLEPAATNSEDAYGAEVLCAGWNPVAVAADNRAQDGPIRSSTPAKAPEADDFLQVVYRSQRI